MIKIIPYLEKLEITSSTLEKQNILQELLQVEGAREVLELVYNSETYNLSTRSFENMFGSIGELSDPGLLVAGKVNGQFECSWKHLVTRIIPSVKQESGNLLLQNTKRALELLKPLHAKWVTRVLNKDLRVGVQVTLVNKVLSKMELPIIYVHDVQLAEKIDDITSWDTFPIGVGTKYDGMRCEVEKKGEFVKLTSRQGENIASYLPEIVEHFKTFDGDFIIDGEVMAKDFNTLQKRIGRKAENITTIEGLYFRVFDILEYAGNDYTTATQLERTESLRLLFPETEMFKHEVFWIVTNKEQLLKIWNEHMDNKEEGIMIKLLDKPYNRGSRKNWFKVKKYVENTFEVTGWDYGSGRFSKTVGKIHVKDISGTVTSSVGTGLTDDMRNYLLQLAGSEELIGRLVEVGYNEVSKDARGNKSLRHPRFLKFRDDISQADNLGSPEGNGLMKWL